MRIAVVLAAVLTIACRSKDEPRATKADPPSSAPAAAEAGPPGAGATAESIVPKSILSRLGDSRVVIAIDFTKLKSKLFEGGVPPIFGCVGDMVQAAGVAVIGIDNHDAVIGFVTKLPQSVTDTCMGSLGFKPVATGDGAEQFEVDGRRLSVVWRDDMAIIKEDGKEITGSLSNDMRELIAVMSPAATGWVIIDNFDNWKRDGAERATFSFEPTDDEFVVRGSLDGTRPGSAKQFVTELKQAADAGLQDAGVAVKDGWFKTSSTESSAAFEAKLPLNALPLP